MKLRLLTAAMLVVTPLAAQALGLGRLSVDSGLDEPLNGQIELISPTSQEIKTLKASLASREDFDIAGIERAPHLFDIKYTVTQKSDGRYYLKVHTDQPIREPFLHFLVQVEWNGGRLIREYTTLLDPPQWVEGAPADISVPETAAIEELPELVPEPVAPAPVAAVEPAVAEAAEAEKTQLGLADAAPEAVTPAAAEPPATVAEAAPTAETAAQPTPETQPTPEPVASDAGMEVGPLAATPAPVAAPAPAPAAEPTAPVAARAAAPFEYGPVKRGDTLSRIAGEITPDATLTSQQVMIALLRANPQAFYNNNVNILRAGKILKVPDREQIAAVSRGDAAREFQVQYDAWQEYKLKLAGASRVVAVASEEPKPAAAPEAPKADAKKKGDKAAKADKAPKTGKGAVKAEPLDLLRIVRANLEQEIAEDSTKTPGVETKQDGSKEQRALGERVATLEEAIESKQMQNKDLRDRVGKLQEQVQNTERLIDLENKDLALAQKQAAEKAAAEKLAAEKAALEKAEAEKLAAEKAAAEKLAAEKAAADKVAADKLAAEKAAADKAAQAQAPTPKIVPPAAPVAPTAKKPVPAPPPAPEPSFLDGILASLLDNSLALAVLAGIGVLAAGVGGLYAYRRRRASREFSESILTGTSLTTESSLSDTSAPSGASDTSFLSDFSQGGMGNIHTDEVDPIAEAEVYLAYGRDEQAEEILKDAIVKDPVRQELKGKLLEIYFQRNDTGAFETLAEELYAQLEGKGGKVWEKVEDMGRKLSPSNPMFRGGRPAAAPVAAATTLMASAAPRDTGATTMLVSESAPGASTGLDFTSMSMPEPAPEPVAASSGGGLDFNINFDSTPAPAATGLDMSFDLDTAVSEPPPTSGGLDMDLSFGESAAATDSSSNLIDFSAPSLPEGGGIEFDTNASASLGGDAIEFGSEVSDSGAIEFDVEAPSEVGEAALPGWDETATKLDLAKAYIDMGDSEGARSILDEVLAEGNDQQKRQARELAAQIAA